MGNKQGFTLLEVLIAIAIMALSFGTIISIQSNAMRSSTMAKRMNTVSMLAKNAMIEAEYAIEGKSFDEMKGEKSGSFEAPYQDYSWTRAVKEIEFPNMMPSKKEGGGEDGGSEMLTRLVTKYLSKAVRELVVTIRWKQNGADQSYTISTYWVDLNHEFQLQE